MERRMDALEIGREGCLHLLERHMVVLDTGREGGCP